MKNKTKKILAGVGLGLVGMGALTGCSMSEEQKNALDSVVNKADEIIQLVDTQNKMLSKESAYEMIVLSTNAFQMGLINEVNMVAKSKYYSNYFEEELEEESHGQEIKYKVENNVKKFSLIGFNDTDKQTNNLYADFNNDKYFQWENNEEAQPVNKDIAYELTVAGQVMNAFFVDSLSDPEDIYDIDVLEDGSYSFMCLQEYDVSHYTYIKRFKIEIKDNLLQKYEEWSVEKNNETGDISSWHMYSEFKYDNIDFTEFDAKVATLN